MSDAKRIDEFDEEEEVGYQKWVQRRYFEEREAKVAEKEDKTLKEEKDSRPLPNHARKGGPGRIIIGAILIVIAVVVALSLGPAKSIQETSVDYCLIESGFTNL